MSVAKSKHTANVALLLALVVYLASLFAKHLWSSEIDGIIGLIHAVSEAALVGGIADWFAVTALFTKPLGFPYHTALIPRNRARLVLAMANMVQNDLLSVASIQSKLAQIRFVNLLIRWVEHQGGKEFLADFVTRYVAEGGRHIEVAGLAAKIDTIIKQQVVAWPIAVAIQKLAKLFFDSKQDQRLIEFLLKMLQQKAGQPATRDKIYNYINQYAKGQTSSNSLFALLKQVVYEAAQALDAVNAKDAAVALQQEIITTLVALEAADHPARIYIQQGLRKSLEQLADDPEQVKAIEHWKNSVVDRVDLASLIAKIINLTLASLTVATAENADTDKTLLERYRQLAKKSPLLGWILAQFTRYWSVFLQDQAKQDWVERHLQQAVGSIVVNQHEFIGLLVKDVLEQLSDQALIEFIEDKAGEDLQWIRINGSLVGGFIGLIVYLFVHYVYYPWVLPLI